MNKILIVEDEVAIANGLKFNFEAEGYEAIVCPDGVSALQLLEAEPQRFDLIVLDLMLPNMSGYETCRRIREKQWRLPVLILSAREMSEDKMLAFDCGSDQYMTKPFALPELLARVRSLIKRYHEQLSAPPTPATSEEPDSDLDSYDIGDVHIDFKQFTVVRDHKTHSLTTIETQLLRYFIEHAGDVLSRSEIMENVWGESAEITTRSIDNFVLRLRKYIEPNPRRPQHLLSVRGTGYRFVEKAE